MSLPMNNVITTTLAIIGNVTSALLFMSQIPTYYKIIRAKTIGGFSGVPAVITILNCALWVFYGLPMVTANHLLVVTINGAGFVLEVIYVAIHLAYGTKSSRIEVLRLLAGLSVFFVAVVGGTLGGTHSMDKRKTIVGVLCVIVSITMYSSPLTVMGDVIRTKSTKYMPFFLSFSCFLNGILWAVYAILTLDPYIAVPNGLGALIAAVQLILYGIYYKHPGAQDPSDPKLHSDKTFDQGPQKLDIDMERAS